MVKMVPGDLQGKTDQRDLRVLMDQEETEGEKVHLVHLVFPDPTETQGLVEIREILGKR